MSRFFLDRCAADPMNRFRISSYGPKVITFPESLVSSLGKAHGIHQTPS